MARVIGGRRRRLGDETVRLLTTGVALAIGVGAVFGGIGATRAGVGVPGVVLALLVAGPLLVAGKLLADRRLLGRPASRRAQDTDSLGERLMELPDTWWVLPDAFVGGAGTEFLVVGPGGVFAVEVFRWLARDTGTSFHERVASDLAARARQLGDVLGRMTGSRRSMRVQPVYVSMEAEGIRVGDLLVHATAGDLYVLQGVIIATRDNLLPLLRAGGSDPAVTTDPLDGEMVDRLGAFLARPDRR